MTLPLPTAAIERLSACVEELAGVDATGLSGSDQAEPLKEVRRAETRLAAVRLAVLAAADQAQTARACGAADTGQWAAAVGRLDPVEGHRQVDLAKALSGRSVTREALAEGTISTEHAEVIARADRDLPSGVTDEQRRQIEADLVEKAKTLSPSVLRRAARRALAVVEPDETVVDAHEDQVVVDRETRARARTRLSLHENGDGTVTGHFTVPDFHGQLLRKVLEAITAPRRGRLGASEAQAGPGTSDGLRPRPGPGVLRDRRTPPHRPPAPPRGRDHRGHPRRG